MDDSAIQFEAKPGKTLNSDFLVRGLVDDYGETCVLVVNTTKIWSGDEIAIAA